MKFTPSRAVYLGSVMLVFGGVSPCDCNPKWDRFRVGNLDVRECRRCGATWTERHQRQAENVVMF